MRVLECFAGIGGFALAWERLGCEHAAFIEIDPFCQAVLRERFPGVPIHDDIKTFSAIPLRGRIDIISGGPPCQPASVAGKRRGHEDERWLWPEYLRLVRECSPRWVVAENPTGIVTLRPNGLDWICQELEAAGYQCCPVVVGADDVGAPHRRKRVWIVAHSIDAGLGEHGGPVSVPAEHDPVERCRLDDPDLPGSGDTGQADSRIGLDRSREPDRRTAWPSGPEAMAYPTSEREGCFTRTLGPEESGESCYGDQPPEISPSRSQAWPAGPGQPQHEWEPPRTIARSQPWFCNSVDGLPPRLATAYRRDALKSLGNAIVPQVAEAIGRAILAADKIPPRRKMTP